MQKTFPVHVVGLHALGLDAGLVGVGLVAHPGGAAAGQQEIVAAVAQGGVDVHALELEGGVALEDFGSQAAHGIAVAEPARHLGNGRAGVDRWLEHLGVGPQHGEAAHGVGLALLLAVELEQLFGAGLPLLAVLFGPRDLLQPPGAGLLLR